MFYFIPVVCIHRSEIPARKMLLLVVMVVLDDVLDAVGELRGSELLLDDLVEAAGGGSDEAEVRSLGWVSAVVVQKARVKAILRWG